jgi:transcriptional regulator with PAS, ATPase and Fis domain
LPVAHIAVIAPHEDIAESVHNAKKRYNLDIDVYVCRMATVVETAEKIIRGARPKVIISRGGTALLIRDRFSVNVVEIKMSLADVAHAICQARRHGTKILFLGFSNHIKGVAGLGSLMGMEIHEKIMSDFREARNIIKGAIQEGFHAVVGGAIQHEIAVELGMNSVFLRTGETAVYNAYLEASAILNALSVEERKTQEIRTILDYSRDGFLAIDRHERVTLINRSAARFLRGDEKKLTGKPLAAAHPALSFLARALLGKPEDGELVTINGKGIFVETIPLKDRDEVIGAMATLKEAEAVQNDETRIRHKQYLNGLCAHYAFADITGKSPALVNAKETARGYARVDSTVLIVSESGTGKELFAQSIHNEGRRGGGPFVGINCASLSGGILESELFGYVDGAFTGAKKGGKAGIFEMANRGTTFLDEIGEMSPHIQGKLLRVLQERCVMRLGDTKIIPIDVRVIAATNRDLVEDVKKGRFRKDLFFRLDVLRLSIPPLRERTEDIPALCAQFLKRFLKDECWELSPACIDALARYVWPGNIRELENLMERLSILGKEKSYAVITRHIADMGVLAQASPAETRPRVNHAAVTEALLKSGGSKQKAAALLGIHRSTLYRYLE